MSNFFYHLREGVRSMWTHGFMTFASIGITVACLLIMGTFSLLAFNANNILAELEQDNEILCFIDEGYTVEQGKSLVQYVNQIQNVKDAHFISRKEARDTFVAKYEDEELYQDLDEEVFRHRFSVHIKDITKLKETADQLATIEGIVEVSAYEDISEGFITIRNVAGIVSIALIAILLLVSLFIMSNTIKLTTMDRQEEIAIMKIVGATNHFIRQPFVFEGMLIGIVSGALAFGLQWFIYEEASNALAVTNATQLLTMVPFTSVWQFVAISFGVIGLLIGVCGSLTAIRRFLHV